MARKAGKARKRVSVRRALFKQELDRTGNALQSALAAGYAPSTAKSESYKMAQQARSELVEALIASGFTSEFRAKKLMELAQAKTPKWNPKRNRFELFDAGDIQLRTQQEINQLFDEYPAPKEKVEDNRAIIINFPGKLSDLMPATAQK